MKRISIIICVALFFASFSMAENGRIFSSWQAFFENAPDTVLNVKVNQKDFCDFELKSNDKKASKKVKNLVKNAMIVELDSSMYLFNGRYLNDNKFGGAWMVKHYAPMLCNDKLAVLQLMRPDRDPEVWAWAFMDDDTFYALLDSGYKVADIIEMAAKGSDDAYYYMINHKTKQLQRIDYDIMMALLDFYPDLRRRYDMMVDNEYPYMIRSFFNDFMMRIQQDDNFDVFWKGL